MILLRFSAMVTLARIPIDLLCNPLRLAYIPSHSIVPIHIDVAICTLSRIHVTGTGGLPQFPPSFPPTLPSHPLPQDVPDRYSHGMHAFLRRFAILLALSLLPKHFFNYRDLFDPAIVLIRHDFSCRYHLCTYHDLGAVSQ